MGSYVWKESWAPNYHPAMYISLGAMVISTAFAIVIRQVLVHKNTQLDRAFLSDSGLIVDSDDEGKAAARRARIEEAARLEGLTFEEALERKKGFRYLY